MNTKTKEQQAYYNSIAKPKSKTIKGGTVRRIIKIYIRDEPVKRCRLSLYGLKHFPKYAGMNGIVIPYKMNCESKRSGSLKVLWDGFVKPTVWGSVFIEIID